MRVKNVVLHRFNLRAPLVAAAACAVKRRCARSRALACRRARPFGTNGELAPARRPLMDFELWWLLPIPALFFGLGWMAANLIFFAPQQQHGLVARSERGKIRDQGRLVAAVRQRIRGER